MRIELERRVGSRTVHSCSRRKKDFATFSEEIVESG